MGIQFFNKAGEAITEIQHTGRVLDTFVKCDRVMSDIYADQRYATVLNDDGSTFTVLVGSTFELSTLRSTVVIDATPRLKARHAVVSFKNKEAKARKEFRTWRSNLWEFPAPRKAGPDSKGKLVKVVAGRKAKGLEGTQKVFMPSKYSAGFVVGIEFGDGLLWINADHVVVAAEKAASTPVESFVTEVRENIRARSPEDHADVLRSRVDKHLSSVAFKCIEHGHEEKGAEILNHVSEDWKATMVEHARLVIPLVKANY